MPGLVDERRLPLGIASPQEEDHPIAAAGHRPDDLVGKLLPADPAVRCRGAGKDRQGRIQKEDPLPGPFSRFGRPDI